jgi:limonene-1,2-epoxide hydrolase
VKLTRFLLVCLCWTLAGEKSHAAPQNEFSPLEVVRSKFAAFNQHDAHAIEEIYAGAATLNSPDYNNLVGNKAIADTYRKLFDSIPDAKDNIERLESVDKRVYVQFTLTGHWNGMQDKPIGIRIMAIYTVEDGRIIEDATYYDRKGS